MGGGVSAVLTDLNTNVSNGKHMVGSLFGNGTVVVIGVMIALAVLAGVVIYLQKKKKGNKGKNENE